MTEFQRKRFSILEHISDRMLYTSDGVLDYHKQNFGLSLKEFDTIRDEILNYH